MDTGEYWSEGECENISGRVDTKGQLARHWAFVDNLYVFIVL